MNIYYLNQFCNDNDLLLNKSNTNFTNFTTLQGKLMKPVIAIDDQVSLQTVSTKFLGLMNISIGRIMSKTPN